MKRSLIVACMLVLCACGGSAPASGSARRSPQARDDGEATPAFRRSCEDYSGAPVEISYEDAPGGAAVVYRTRGNVEGLRQRTEEVARFHNSARGKTRWLHDLYQIPHRAYVARVDGGAKLILVPKGARRWAQDELRVHVQQDVWIMRREGCGAGQEAL